MIGIIQEFLTELQEKNPHSTFTPSQWGGELRGKGILGWRVEITWDMENIHVSTRGTRAADIMELLEEYMSHYI